MTCRLSRPIGGCGDTSGDFPLASALRLDRGKGVYRPVTKRAMMMMVKICIVPCMPTTKWKSRSCLRRRAEGAYRSYRISKLGKGYGFLWQSCLPRSSEGPWRWRCARCSDYRGLGVVTLPFRRFPPPWSVEEPVFHRARRQRPGARLCLFRGRDRPAAETQYTAEDFCLF